MLAADALFDVSEETGPFPYRAGVRGHNTSATGAGGRYGRLRSPVPQVQKCDLPHRPGDYPRTGIAEEVLQDCFYKTYLNIHRIHGDAPLRPGCTGWR